MTRADRERRGQRTRRQRLSVVLPIPPSTNHLYATVRGRRVLSEAGRNYHSDAGWLVKEAAGLIGWETREDQRYQLELTLYWPNSLRRDLSNAIKCLEDAAVSALNFDDSRIDRLVVERGSVDKANPRAELTISVL